MKIKNPQRKKLQKRNRLIPGMVVNSGMCNFECNFGELSENPDEINYNNITPISYIYMDPKNEIHNYSSSSEVDTKISFFETQIMHMNYEENWASVYQSLMSYEAKYSLSSQEMKKAYNARDFNKINNIDPDDLEKWLSLFNKYYY